MACPNNCDECFYANGKSHNYTLGNEFTLLTDEEALARGLKLQCGTCSLYYTLDWDLKTCLRCPSDCLTCNYASLINTKSIYPAIYLISTEPNQQQIITENITLRCSLCPYGIALTSRTLECRVSCPIISCWNCTHSAATATRHESFRCRNCDKGYFPFSYKTNGIELYKCSGCDEYIPGCGGCNINYKETKEQSLCQECKLGGFPVKGGVQCARCSGCRDETCSLRADTQQVKRKT